MTSPAHRTREMTAPRIIVYVGIAVLAFTACAGALSTVGSTAELMRTRPLASFVLLVLLSLLTVWVSHRFLRAPGEGP